MSVRVQFQYCISGKTAQTFISPPPWLVGLHTQTSSPHAECAPAVPLTEYQHLSSSAYNVLYHFAIVHEVEGNIICMVCYKYSEFSVPLIIMNQSGAENQSYFLL